MAAAARANVLGEHLLTPVGTQLTMSVGQPVCQDFEKKAPLSSVSQPPLALLVGAESPRVSGNPNLALSHQYGVRRNTELPGRSGVQGPRRHCVKFSEPATVQHWAAGPSWVLSSDHRGNQCRPRILTHICCEKTETRRL